MPHRYPADHAFATALPVSMKARALMARKVSVKKIVGLMLVLAACGGGGNSGSQQEAFTAFGAATAAMGQAQAKAVAAAKSLVTPEVLTINYTGPCTTSGSTSVTGSYDTSGSGQAAAFDMTVGFDACADAQGTLDGSITWTSTVSSTGYTAAMQGDIDYASPQGSASCEFDLTVSVANSGASVTYKGKVCGYSIDQAR
jgi:hypothetical protein